MLCNKKIEGSLFCDLSNKTFLGSLKFMKTHEGAVMPNLSRLSSEVAAESVKNISE